MQFGEWEHLKDVGLGLFQSTNAVVVKGVITLVLLIPVLLGRKLAIKVISQHFHDVKKRYLAIRTLNYVIGGVILVIILALWLEGGKSLVTYIGIISAGLAVALQGPIQNTAGWIFISLKKPFAIGDRIEINKIVGDVVDLGFFHFSVLEVGNWSSGQSTGRITHVPNGLVFSQHVHNFTAGFSFIWNEMPITVTFESDWQAAKKILSDIIQKYTMISTHEAEEQIRRATQKYLISWQYLTPIVWTDVSSNGVRLTLRYLTEPRKKRSSEHQIWEEILLAFAQHPDIHFAYNTTRIYQSDQAAKTILFAGDR